MHKESTYILFQELLSENAITMVNKFGQKYHCELPVQVGHVTLYLLFYLYSERNDSLLITWVLPIIIAQLLEFLRV